MYDVTPAREHDAWECGSVRTHHNDEGDTWHTRTAAAQDYRDDDADARESEARQKPVFPRKGDPFDAPNGGSKRELGRKGDDDHGYYRLAYDDAINAGLHPKHLPETEGGNGKPHPMDAVADAERMRGLRAAYGDKRAQAFVNDKRTLPDGTRFVVPVGHSPWGRPLRGKLSYLRKWSDPTGNMAVSQATGAPKDGPIVLHMTRGKAMRWLEMHRILVENGKLQDQGRTAVLESIVTGIKPGQIAGFRVYSRADLTAFRHVPKRYQKGAFGEFVRFVANI